MHTTMVSATHRAGTGATLPLTILLVASGLLAVAIGGTLLLAPGAFYASYGIDFAPGAALLSEKRASGSALMVFGAVIAAGGMIDRLRGPATALTALLFLAYGLGRLVAVALDGIPGTSLVAAGALELAIGLGAVVVLLRRRAA